MFPTPVIHIKYFMIFLTKEDNTFCGVKLWLTKGLFLQRGGVFKRRFCYLMCFSNFPAIFISAVSLKQIILYIPTTKYCIYKNYCFVIVEIHLDNNYSKINLNLYFSKIYTVFFFCTYNYG